MQSLPRANHIESGMSCTRYVNLIHDIIVLSSEKYVIVYCCVFYADSATKYFCLSSTYTVFVMIIQDVFVINDHS